jgi:biopolymer transport protein ExbB
MPEEEMMNEGLGLAEAAGLGENAHEAGFNFFASFWQYFQNDLISSIPITICSILVFAVVLERFFFYNRNNRDISKFIQNLQKQLEKGNLESAQMLASQLNSVTGEVAEEGVRLLAVQKEDFSRAYDITVAIVIRKLQKFLPILATVGAIAPFLGLFGTVSGVIKALFGMSLGSEGASLAMIGEISNALIATGYGLAIAIIAVVANNLFGNIVKRYNDDFMLLKLLFLSFANTNFDLGNLNYTEQPQAYNEYVAQQQANPQQAPFEAPQGQDVNKPPYPDFLK